MESATRRIDSQAPEGWDLTAYLLADVYYALSGETHPARPDPAAAQKAALYADKRRALEAQRERMKAAAR